MVHSLLQSGVCLQYLQQSVGGLWTTPSCSGLRTLTRKCWIYSHPPGSEPCWLDQQNLPQFWALENCVCSDTGQEGPSCTSESSWELSLLTVLYVRTEQTLLVQWKFHSKVSSSPLADVVTPFEIPENLLETHSSTLLPGMPSSAFCNHVLCAWVF